MDHADAHHVHEALLETAASETTLELHVHECRQRRALFTQPRKESLGVLLHRGVEHGIRGGWWTYVGPAAAGSRADPVAPRGRAYRMPRANGRRLRQVRRLPLAPAPRARQARQSLRPQHLLQSRLSLVYPRSDPSTSCTPKYCRTVYPTNVARNKVPTQRLSPPAKSSNPRTTTVAPIIIHRSNARIC